MTDNPILLASFVETIQLLFESARYDWLAPSEHARIEHLLQQMREAARTNDSAYVLFLLTMLQRAIELASASS